MLMFFLLKVTHMTTLSWWWMFGGIFGTVAPMGLSFCFVLMKLFGYASPELSWWWLIPITAVDLVEFHLLRKAVEKYFWR
ncbi:MAG: hypothetical protein IJH07_08070 [Ruminococcus sp.]|nr:hypothetical protein [Ruminococcus sp.]